MSRSQSAGLARHAVDPSHASAAHKAQQPRRTPSASDVVTPAPVSNQALGKALGGGSPLEPSVRAEMESRFGADFSAVRIHDEPSAQAMAQQQRAQAFAVGNHIAFNKGRHAPGQSAGKHLLAHELAHVIQQQRGGVTAPAFAGDRLEQAADHAASAAVTGGGPVQVAGASAVGVARQPLPQDETRDLPAPPRTLSGSLAKDDGHLSDAELDREMTLMEAWLVDLPGVPGRDFMVSEYKALYAERAARRARRTAPRPPRPQPKEGSIASLYGMVEGAPMQSVEVQEAHRAYLATGEIFQTSTPFSWAEIKKGRMMSRAQRYDAMLVKMGMPLAQIEDVVVDNRDPGYLAKDEFHDEFFARVHSEQDECRDLWFKGRQNKCLRGVDDKYGGPAFKADRADREARLRQQIMEVSDKIAAVRDSGAISLAGRVVGYGAGALSGHDALRWSEHGAAIGSLGDAFAPAYAGYTQRSQLRSYNAGGGLEVRRDAPIGLVSGSTAQSTPAKETVAELAHQAETTSMRQPAASVFPSSKPSNENLPGPAAASSATLPVKPAANSNVYDLVAQGMKQLGPQRSLPAEFHDEAGAKFDEPTPLASGFGSGSRKKMAAGTHGVGQRELGVHIDEPLPVGDENVSPARQVDRALDPHNRQMLDSATNPETKHLGISQEIIERNRSPLAPVSLKTPGVSPSVILTRRFSEVTELNEVFEQAVAKIRNKSKYTAGELKEKINGNFWDIVGNGKSPAGAAVRDAFRNVGFEYVPGKGMRAVKSRAAGIKPAPTQEVE